MKQDCTQDGIQEGEGPGPYGIEGPAPNVPARLRRTVLTGPAAETTTDTRQLRDALSCFATGITIVTARAPDGTVAGVTANSFCSVSLEPPLVLWCLSKTAPSCPVFASATHFAIHVLAEDQADLSVRFSKPARDKFAGLEVSEGLARTPLLDGAAAVFECRSAQHYEGGDHFIIVGQVERYRHTDRLPLVFHFGRYCGVGQP